MSADDFPTADPGRPPVRANVLWAGGLATALVAALIGWAGVLVCRSVFRVELVQLGSPDTSNLWTYPIVAFVVAVICTGILHLMLLFVPQPVRFFNWVMGLLLVVATALPFANGANASSLLTAAVDFLTVLAIWLLIAGTAARARRPLPPYAPPAAPPGPPAQPPSAGY